ncbi:MAG TPA: STAS domain-containing protein, partial [Labilithrix sp.]|nr:STAS domain-containing protein [Labilithrix sp.]
LTDEIARLRAELAKKDALIEVIFSQNPDGIAIADADFNVTANPVSDLIFDTTGSSAANAERWPEQHGMFAADGVTPTPVDKLPLVRALKNGEVVTDELMFVRNAKRPEGAWVSITAKPIATGGALSVFRDVTDRKRLEDDLAQRNADLAERDAEKTDLVERLRLAVDELSTPVLEVTEEVLTVPIVGVLDTQRSARMSERVLTEVVARRARYVIVDVTGVEVVDTATADQLIKMALGIELLGSECIITGIQPAVAQALVQLGVELRGFRSQPTLRRAIEYCMGLRRDGDGRKAV